MKKNGFTLIELLISISVVAVISTATISVYKVWQNKNLLGSTRQVVVQAMREAQSQAVSGNNDSLWGVKLNSSTIVVFSGSTYLSRDITKDRVFELPKNVEINGFDELLFSKIYGLPNTSVTTTIGYGGTNVQIKINQQGILSY